MESATALSLTDSPFPTKIVILTGAGISQESGLSTFRGRNAPRLTTKIEDVATPRAFSRNPSAVHGFYNARRAALLDSSVVPNAAHRAVAEFQYRAQQLGAQVILVTQNIDNLHERAGSPSVLHMHGELLKARCVHCGAVVGDWRRDVTTETRCEACKRSGGMRVHVVWFGETPFGMDEIFGALASCTLFVAIGTSGTVYPASGFVEIAAKAGARTVELNLESSEMASNFEEIILGKASTIVPQFLSNITL